MSRRSVVLRSRSDLARRIDLLIPVPRELPITNARLMRTYRSLLAEGISVLWSVLGWSAATLAVRKPEPPPTQRGRAVGYSVGSWNARGMTIASAEHDATYEIAGTGFILEHPLSQAFAGHVQQTLHAAMECAKTLHAGRTGSGTVEIGYEVLVQGLKDRILASFTRELLDEPLSPFGQFMLGYRPFTAPFAVSAAALRWIGSIAASTYEGEAIRTGLVIESTPGILRRSPGVTVNMLDHAIDFRDVSWQNVAIADGERSFLVVDNRFRVSGVAWLANGLDALVKAHPPGAPTLPLAALWFQAQRPELLRLFGTSKESTFQIGHVRRGLLRLHSRLAAETALSQLMLTVVVPRRAEDVRLFAEQLLVRAESGHGAGVVIRSRRFPSGSCPAQPIPVQRDGSWLPFLGPDGAIVVDRELRLRQYGVNLPQPKKKLLPERGTRHNSLAAVSKQKNCIAIAVSDDGSLTAFKDGVVAISIA